MKNSTQLLLSLLFILSGVQSHAQVMTAEGLLTRDLLAKSKTMKNDIKIYNYFFLQQMWPEFSSESGRKSYAHNYLAAAAGAFWNPSFNDASTKNYAAGPAMYTATDPSISQTYGNSFVELTIPAGSKFINIVAPIPVKKDTMAALIAEGLVPAASVTELFPKASGFYRDTLRVMVMAQYAPFRNMVQRIFTANGIQFVEYNFNSNLTGFCTKHSYSAFAYVGMKNDKDPKNAVVAPNFANVTVYSTKYNFEHQSAQEQADFVRIMKFRNLLDQIPNARKLGKSVKELIAATYTPEEVKQIKTATYSCDQ